MKKSKAASARITLGEIERGLSSGKPSAEIKAAAQDAIITFREAYDQALTNISSVMKDIIAAATTSAALAALSNSASIAKELQEVFAPLARDAERAKRLITVMDTSPEADKGVDDAYHELQTEIDAGGPLTAQQVAFLIMQARGIDVGEEIQQYAHNWKMFVNKNRTNSRKSAKYSDEEKQYWLTLAKEIKDSNPSQSSAAGLAGAVLKRLISEKRKFNGSTQYDKSALQSIRKYLAQNGHKKSG